MLLRGFLLLLEILGCDDICYCHLLTTNSADQGKANDPSSSTSNPGMLFVSGMVDIARQTVEFLYEENGGIPRDLYLPTIEDIKDEANKFTIDKVRKGIYLSCLGMLSPGEGLWL